MKVLTCNNICPGFSVTNTFKSYSKTFIKLVAELSECH